MTNKTGACDGSHFKTLQEVDIGSGSFKVLIASEIDSYVDGNKVYNLKKSPHSHNEKNTKQSEDKDDDKNVNEKEPEKEYVNKTVEVESKEADAKGEVKETSEKDDVFKNTEDEAELKNMFEGGDEDVIYVELKSMLCRV
ncbi:unnamed protein product [[Candida] boidinii]|nr:unnamed protein product [[Candida] boidinii]